VAAVRRKTGRRVEKKGNRKELSWRMRRIMTERMHHERGEKERRGLKD